MAFGEVVADGLAQGFGYCLKFIWIPIVIGIGWAIFSMAAKEDQAKKLLISLLKDGPMLATEVHAVAEAENISQDSLQGAKKSLKIVAKQQEGHWYWSRPKKIGGGG